MKITESYNFPIIYKYKLSVEMRVTPSKYAQTIPGLTEISLKAFVEIKEKELLTRTVKELESLGATDPNKAYSMKNSILCLYLLTEHPKYNDVLGHESLFEDSVFDALPTYDRSNVYNIKNRESIECYKVDMPELDLSDWNLISFTYRITNYEETIIYKAED